MFHKLDIIGAAAAATVTTTQIVATNFSGISYISFGIALIVAAFSALTKFFIEVAKAEEDKIERKHLISYSLSGMLAGLMVYLITSYMELHPNLVLFSTAFAGYSGELVLKVGPVQWIQRIINGTKTE